MTLLWEELLKKLVPDIKSLKYSYNPNTKVFFVKIVGVLFFLSFVDVHLGVALHVRVGVHLKTRF